MFHLTADAWFEYVRGRCMPSLSLHLNNLVNTNGFDCVASNLLGNFHFL